MTIWHLLSVVSLIAAVESSVESARAAHGTSSQLAVCVAIAIGVGMVAALGNLASSALIGGAIARNRLRAARLAMLLLAIAVSVGWINCAWVSGRWFAIAICSR